MRKYLYGVLFACSLQGFVSVIYPESDCSFIDTFVISGELLVNFNLSTSCILHPSERNLRSELHIQKHLNQKNWRKCWRVRNWTNLVCSSVLPHRITTMSTTYGRPNTAMRRRQNTCSKYSWNSRKNWLLKYWKLIYKNMEHWWHGNDTATQQYPERDMS